MKLIIVEVAPSHGAFLYFMFIHCIHIHFIHVILFIIKLKWYPIKASI